MEWPCAENPWCGISNKLLTCSRCHYRPKMTKSRPQQEKKDYTPTSGQSSPAVQGKRTIRANCC